MTKFKLGRVVPLCGGKLFTVRKGFLYSLVCFLLIVAISFRPVIAITEAELYIYGQNGIYFYEPDNGCASYSYTTKPTGDQITWIGDSYSVGAESLISKKLPGVDFGKTINNADSYIQGSKGVGYGSSDNPSGLSILEQIIKNNDLRPYLVFALGTNGQWSEDNVNDFLELISKTQTKAVLVTSQIGRGDDYSKSNNRLREAAKTHDNIYLADWTTVYKDNFFINDNIHPTANGGYEAWVNIIYDALPGGSVGSLPGNDNTEKIWNYFAMANIPGVSDDPAVISGIIGNMVVETAFTMDPLIRGNADNGGLYYGLIMWYYEYNPTLVDTLKSKYGDYLWIYGNGVATNPNNVPQHVNDEVLQYELDYLTHNYATWNNFVNHLNYVANKTPESYAELFLVEVERAIETEKTPGEPILDSGVSSHFSSRYQGASGRRYNARKLFDEYASVSATGVVGSYANTNGGVKWDDGWIVEGTFPGLTKEDVTRAPDLKETIYGRTFADGYPNKILLHNTEGTSIGYVAYPSDNKFPAHFIIDLKKKEVVQNITINYRSPATVSGDDTSIQIEIVGFSTREGPYYLQDFSDDDWDYLAVLLIAIAEQTGIPLTTSVNWEAGNRISSNTEFDPIVGIVGHMHSPPGDDHTDPGNIWPQLSDALARNPSASKFGFTSGACGVNSVATELVSGGMDEKQAKEFMQVYKDISPREVSENSDLNTKWGITSTDCKDSDMENCVSFTKYFINRYTNLDTVITAVGNGADVVEMILSFDIGFIDGGTVPKAYAIFSTSSGSLIDPDTGRPYGHTGVILGIDEEKDIIIVGEAACSAGEAGTGVGVYALSEWVNTNYTYAYTDNIINLDGK